MSTSIEIAVLCSLYQRRMDWMMSSLVQQKGNIPRLSFSVAYPLDEGNPKTEDVISLFRKEGLSIREQAYPGVTPLWERGLVRNRQLAETDCEWILWADCDLVYDEYFFEDLGKQLEGSLKGETRCITASRISLDKEFSKKHFNVKDTLQYPCNVPDVGKVVSSWPVYQISRNMGAGYFQLANVDFLRKHNGGFYVNPEHCHDTAVGRFSMYRSDRQFRRAVNGVCKITTKPQYHLNHERDYEVGTYLTNQR
jgi:hypothetical protein